MARLHRTTADAAQCLRRGGILIFPTETFYALGCLASNAAAVDRIYRVKRRNPTQPLPLLAADKRQAAQAACLESAPRALLKRFWPGPLTVLLPANPSLPPPLVDSKGRTALRISPHGLATELARLAGGPLTASSANLHGCRPVCRFRDMDEELLYELDKHGAEAGLFEGDTPPAGGLPSTLVEPLASTEQGKICLRLVRAGAVSAEDLEDAGFCVHFA
ncbi:MAG: L-threonylcarbamoyladenylate synthase [Desulfovibrio sp.]|jgi:L-threonylcarbamoyladenylate synthase|nr:L-threonylcarbamoyladenylate synthase [Desulfovibrio sp.]